MARMTQDYARNLCAMHGILQYPEMPDFHTLSASEVDGVIAAANAWGYRKPKNANGSRARYFHAYIRRALESNQ